MERLDVGKAIPGEVLWRAEWASPSVSNGSRPSLRVWVHVGTEPLPN